MCGIGGVVSLQAKTQRGLVQEALVKMSHRGPDAQGLFETDDQLCCLCFGRLSIVGNDRTLNQPFESMNKEWTILFNGEIYNYLELAEKFSLKLKSDGEILPHLFERFGLAGLRLVRGMFAIFAHNNFTGNSYLVRDKLGVKPLYYNLNSQGVAFASELRALAKLIQLVPDKNSFINSIEMGHFLASETGFKDTFRLLPGEIISIDAQGKMVSKEMIGVIQDLSDPSPVEAFVDSVSKHIDTTQNSILLLSGGFDSAAILWASRELGKTLDSATLKFFNNEEYLSSVRTSEHFNSKLRVIDFRISEAVIENFLDAVDLPSYDGFQLFYLHKVLASEGVRVTLTGHGSDEIFLKYGFHKKETLSNILKSRKILTSEPILNLLKKWSGSNSNKLDRLKYYRDDPYKLFRSILPINNAYSSFTEKSLAENDLIEYLAGMALADLDQYSMAHSVEARVPFLDSKFIESISKNGRTLSKEEFADLIGDSRLIELANLPKVGFGFQAELIDSILPSLLDKYKRAVSSQVFRDFIGESDMRKIHLLIESNPRLYLRSVFQLVALERWFTSFSL